MAGGAVCGVHLLALRQDRGAGAEREGVGHDVPALPLGQARERGHVPFDIALRDDLVPVLRAPVQRQLRIADRGDRVGELIRGGAVSEPGGVASQIRTVLSKLAEAS